MDAFFESPKHNLTNTTESNEQQHQQQQDIIVEEVQQQLHEVVVNRRLDLDQDVHNFETLQVIDSSTTTTTSSSNNQQQLTELTNADMSSHVKLEMENGQVVVVDSNQTVVLVAASTSSSSSSSNNSDTGQQQQILNGNEIVIQQQNSDGTTTTMLLDPSQLEQQQQQQLLVTTQNALGLVVDNDDSNQMDPDDPDASDMKDIDDTLAMSPGFVSSLGGSLSGTHASYMLNGNNVSTHTFRKTEWDVKKLENYVRLSFGDATPMEGMPPVKMNFYLVSFFKLAKKSDGMDYEPESLIGFMNSFERYLKTKNYPESLLRSETFKESRTELKKKRDLVRSIGKLIRTKTKDTCYLLQFHRNLLKEKGLLNRDNPDCLLAEIYLNNMIYFGEFLKEDKAWRGNLNLVWGDMLLERDLQNGLEYLTLATYAKKSSRNPTGAVNNTQTPPPPQQQQQQQQQQSSPKSTSRTKTGTQTSKLRAAVAAAAAAAAANPTISHHTQSSSDANSPRVYARQPASYCPIEAYKMYKSRRPNNCLDRDSPFYLAPLFKSKNQSKVWYKALAMSCQRLDALFYCLFKKAGVDLASLASMSQQQQQQAVAAAASIINGSNENQLNNSETINNTSLTTSTGTTNNNNNVSSSSLTQWKSAMKEHNNQIPDEMNDLIMNGSIKHVSSNNNNNTSDISYHHQQQQQHHHQNNTNNHHQQQQQQQQTFYTNQSSAGVQQQQHHIITTVPAQVQVQVQVQVQIPQHQQQNSTTSTLIV